MSPESLIMRSIGKKLEHEIRNARKPEFNADNVLETRIREGLKNDLGSQKHYGSVEDFVGVRHHQNLSRDVAQRVCRDVAGLGRWNTSGIEERKSLLTASSKVMMREMSFPPELRESVSIQFKEGKEVAGEEAGIVCLSESVLLDDKFADALGGLYRELYRMETHLPDSATERVGVLREGTKASDMFEDVYADYQKDLFVRELNQQEFPSPAELPEAEKTEELFSSIYEHFSVEEVQMIQDIRRTVENDEQLRLDTWSRLDAREKNTVLQNLENRIAEIEHRMPTHVIVEDMRPGLCGYADTKRGIIAISTAEVYDNSMKGLRDVVDTIIHEGRHSYQYQNVFQNRTEINDLKYQGWIDNYDYGYLTQEMFGYDAYRNQPLEADAWAFADETVSGINFK